MPGLRVLTYLLAVAETGNFSRAAERCSVSQSTLSGQLRRLEDFLGVELIRRDHGLCVPTEAGERVIPWAAAIVQATGKLRQVALAETYSPVSVKIVEEEQPRGR